VRRLIVEADGGSRGNPGPAGYGALVRDADTGELLAEVSDAIGVATNNVAEYRGVIAGLQAAREIDPDASVEARLDSKLIVEQMSGRWKIKNPDLKPLALEARRLFPADRVTYTWVPRAQNTHADRLANEAMDGNPTSNTRVRGDTGGTRPVVNAPVAAPSPIRAVAPDLTVATELLLVRHGRTADTVARRFSGGGPPGPPLDDVGRGQAKQAADALAGTAAVAVIASPMVRTQQTADIIATRLGHAVTTDPDWRECEFGEWEGQVIEDVIAHSPAEISAWRDDTSVRPRGGESLDAMIVRVMAARDRLLDKFAGQTVVVVTHSLPVRAMVTDVLGAPPTAIHRLRPAPGSITEVRYEAGGAPVVTGFSKAGWPTS
jgi:ribonuclease H / adenosylcobalamin/alpha-ribazole phosphatase